MKSIIKLSILLLCVAGIILVVNIKNNPVSAQPVAPLTPQEISWVEFCKARGYDTHDNRDEIINEFLDTWVGSVEEERAFNNLPAQEV